jgi:hypothetical protein
MQHRKQAQLRPNVAEPTIRVMLRLPAALHDEVRSVARRERINLSDALLRRIEEGSKNRRDKYQQLGDLLQACKLLDANQRPRLKRAIAEQLNNLYHLNLPIEDDGIDSEPAALCARGLAG